MAAESEAASVTPELRNQAARDWLRIRASNFMASNEDQQRGRGTQFSDSYKKDLSLLRRAYLQQQARASGSGGAD
ncbi:TPA: hypothetical protein ACH3X3_008829 [Trebouxia sp. C0006]